MVGGRWWARLRLAFAPGAMLSRVPCEMDEPAIGTAKACEPRAPACSRGVSCQGSCPASDPREHGTRANQDSLVSSIAGRAHQALEGVLAGGVFDLGLAEAFLFVGHAVAAARAWRH